MISVRSVFLMYFPVFVVNALLERLVAMILPTNVKGPQIHLHLQINYTLNRISIIINNSIITIEMQNQHQDHISIIFYPRRWKDDHNQSHVVT